MNFADVLACAYMRRWRLEITSLSDATEETRSSLHIVKYIPVKIRARIDELRSSIGVNGTTHGHPCIACGSPGKDKPLLWIRKKTWAD